MKLHIWIVMLGTLPVTVYLLVVGGLYIMQRSLVFHTNADVPDLAAAAVPGLTAVQIPTEDGLSLLAWYLPPPTPDAPIIVYFHGNAGTIGDRSEHLRQFAKAGFGVLFPEFRGYGGNPGSPSETHLLHDCSAALAFLARASFPQERIVLYGESLGTGIAVALGQNQPFLAVALEAPYSSLLAVAESRYPWIPVRQLLWDTFDSLGRIGAVHAPLFIAQGALDVVVPPEQGKALFAAAHEPKQLWIAPTGGHNNLFGLGGTDAAITFIQHAASIHARTTPSP
jgi:fermentation-respiration switch protein FrsA (DUF1100 family)